MACRPVNFVPPTSIPLIDPTGHGGLIHVPFTKTLDTKGRQEYLKGILRKEVSLCCLFQKGRCHAHEKCHQIHVDQSFIRAIRQQNAHIISCCRACNDTASLSSNAVSFFATYMSDMSPSSVLRIILPDGTIKEIPGDRIAFTVGLVQFAEAEKIIQNIPAKKLCRLHLRGACKYGKDCKNVHLCTRLGFDWSPSTTPIPQMPTVTVGVRPRSTVTPPPCSIMEPPTQPRVLQMTPPPSAVGMMDHLTPSLYQETNVSRSSSVSAATDYFISDRFVTPPPAPETTQNEPEEEELDQLRPLDVQNLSFLAKSVKVQGLCFDPLLIAQEEQTTSSKHLRALSVDWLDASLDCGASSTTSRASSRQAAPVSSDW